MLMWRFPSVSPALLCWLPWSNTATPSPWGWRWHLEGSRRVLDALTAPPISLSASSALHGSSSSSSCFIWCSCRSRPTASGCIGAGPTGLPQVSQAQRGPSSSCSSSSHAFSHMRVTDTSSRPKYGCPTAVACGSSPTGASTTSQNRPHSTRNTTSSSTSSLVTFKARPSQQSSSNQSHKASSLAPPGPPCPTCCHCHVWPWVPGWLTVSQHSSGQWLSPSQLPQG